MRFYIFILLLLFLPLTSAVEIQLNKASYAPGETLLATIEGNFLEPINIDNIYFYSGRLRIPLEYNFMKVEDKYYIYALLPYTENNYTLLIKEVHYMQGSIEKNIELEKNFTAEGEIVDFSVSPGFILANKDFQIKIINNQERFTLTSDFNNQQKLTELRAGETKKLDFSISGFSNFTFTELKLSSPSISYSIPVIVIASSLENKSIILEKDLRFKQSSLDITAEINSEKTEIITLNNYGDSDLSVSLIYPKKFDEVLIISPLSFDLKAGESQDINITIQSSKSEFFEGYILASSESNSSIYLRINITPLPSSSELKSCAEMGGKFCTILENCNLATVASLDGSCCLGICSSPVTPPATKSSTGKYIAIVVIILIILALLFFVYKKYKSKSKTSSEILKQKSSSFEERFKPTETRGSLSKV